MTGNQWWLITTILLSLDLVCYRVAFGAYSQASVTKSAVKHLQDHGTYIIYFRNNVTEIELQHFSAILERKSVAKIIGKHFIINCLTAKLSKEALQWVRM